MKKKNNKVILVTGATGFLGSAVTMRLLVLGYELRLLITKRHRNRSITEGFILNNRMDEFLYGLFLDNVEIFEGDITSKYLGLGEDTYKKICSEVDEVFHCAAATHFDKQRAGELIMVNVNGTENMLRFTNSGKQKRFHYVSTAYVAGKGNGVVFEDELDKEPQFNNEYERSKFVAEQMVVQYAKENVIPYTIYRPSIIVGDSRAGFTCKFDNLYLFAKVLFNIKRSCHLVAPRRMKIGFPARQMAGGLAKARLPPFREDSRCYFRIKNGYIDHQKGDLIEDRKEVFASNQRKNITVRVPGYPNALVNLVPIDYVSEAIVAISRKRESVDKIFHITNPNPPTLKELRDLLMSVLEIKGVDISIDGQMEHKHLSTIERLFLRQTRTYYPYIFGKLRFDCNSTQNTLKGTGINCPVITHDLIKILLDYAISHNWGEGELVTSQKVVMV